MVDWKEQVLKRENIIEHLKAIKEDLSVLQLTPYDRNEWEEQINSNIDTFKRDIEYIRYVYQRVWESE